MPMEKVLCAVALLLGVATSSAHASTYNWSFVCGYGASCSGSGSLATDIPAGPAVITSISGEYGGETITGLLAPGAFPVVGLDIGTNDNVLQSLSSPELNYSGLSFTTATLFVNLYYSQISDFSFHCVNITCLGGYVDVTGVFSITSPVPIPAALPLFAAGLGAMGFMGWRRKRKALKD